MKDVGIKLQDKRNELKLSYEDVSKMTKLPITTIKAIEAGNLDHFQNDLTYVRFYVQSYCKAMDIPYAHFKDDVLDSVDEYTSTMSLNALKKHEEMEANISARRSEKNIQLPEDKKPKYAKKDRTSIAQNTQQNKRFTNKKRIDFPFLSLIIVIVLIACIVIGVGIKSLMSTPSSPSNDDPISNNQPDTPKVEEEGKKEEKPDKGKVSFNQVNPAHYEIKDIKVDEDIKIEVTFKNQGSFNLWKGTTSVPGAYNVFESNATYTYEGKVVANEVFTFNFWNYGGATIKVNGTTLKYDEKALLPDANGTTFFALTTKGE